MMNIHLLCRFSTLGSQLLNLLDHSITGNDITKDHVFPVQPVRLGGGDEELTPVGAGATVGHRQHSRPSVGQLEILISKLKIRKYVENVAGKRISL